jgi:hypothetical protein
MESDDLEHTGVAPRINGAHYPGVASETASARIYDGLRRFRVQQVRSSTL